jgi:hypothetical protein
MAQLPHGVGLNGTRGSRPWRIGERDGERGAQGLIRLSYRTGGVVRLPASDNAQRPQIVGEHIRRREADLSSNLTRNPVRKNVTLWGGLP